jgi:hypothetical protein
MIPRDLRVGDVKYESLPAGGPATELIEEFLAVEREVPPGCR